jgi:hypothetical protein
MKHIVEFPLESGDSVLVEVNEPDNSDDRISIRDELTHKAQQTFEAALERVKPVASAIMTKVRSLNEPADEVEVKFGLKMSAELGAIVASGTAEANYEITLKWKRDSKDDHTP